MKKTIITVVGKDTVGIIARVEPRNLEFSREIGSFNM